MKSYIAKQPKITKERVEAKLDQNLVRRLEQYCQYLDSDRDYIISQALIIAFKKDVGFNAWLGSRGATSAAASQAKAGK